MPLKKVQVRLFEDMPDFIAHFSIIPDPRVDRTKKYPLIEILFLCMSAVVAGADGWEEIEDFGTLRLDWLRQYLPYANGIPYHDTIARVMSRLDTKVLQQSFISWMQDVFILTNQKVIAIDGKSVRRSFTDGNRKNAIHMVSAWSAENKAVLGQVKVAEKSNEITAIPELLDILAIKGAIITIDAMGCQKAIAEKIHQKKGDYILGLKGNQKDLHAAVKELFSKNINELTHDEYEQITKEHGRIEHRVCKQFIINQEYLPEGSAWKGLKSIIEITSSREVINGESSQEKRYYISSLDLSAKRAWHSVKDHWGIENSLHWSLDMAYREDECRIRRENGAEFFSVMRRISMNIIKKDTSKKAGINRKRKMAGMDPLYHAKLMYYFQDI